MISKREVRFFHTEHPMDHNLVCRILSEHIKKQFLSEEVHNGNEKPFKNS